MALSFPLTDLIDRLKIESVEWPDPFNQEMALAGDGSRWVKDIAPPLIRAKLTSAAISHDATRQGDALLNALLGSLRTFYVWDPLAPYPQYDPTGSILGASTVQIHTVDGALEAMRLKGLPAAYVITLGDRLSFDHSSSPVRRAYHASAETVTADGSGVTPLFAVSTPLPTGAAADQVVTLKKPSLLMRLVPHTKRVTSAGRMKARISFDAEQVIRA